MVNKTILGYIWQYSLRQQIWIAVVVFAAIPTYYLSLSLPKEIVNGPLMQASHDYADTPAVFFGIHIPSVEWLGLPGRTLFEGVPLDRYAHLAMLSLALLALIAINGGFKFYINLYKGRLAERLLRRMRFQLVDRVLRFPQRHARRMKPTEVANMINIEVSPLGGFIGEACASPLFLLAQAGTALTFILMQNATLGMIAILLAVLQVGIISRLRRRFLHPDLMRQGLSRAFAGRVAEIVEGLPEIRTNDGSNWQRADVSYRLGELYDIRDEYLRVKLLLKFLNNFATQLTPFVFYLAGGYMVITGTLDVGQLVAVIAAYRDSPPPIKDLMHWDQQRIDAQVKYSQVVMHFSPKDMDAPEMQAVRPSAEDRPEPTVRFRAVSLGDGPDRVTVANADFGVEKGARLAIVGDDPRALAMIGTAVARLTPPVEGQILLGERDMATLPDAVFNRSIAYVGAGTYFPKTSLRDALLCGIRNRADAHGSVFDDFDPVEARRTGNTATDPRADWLDLPAARLGDPTALDARLFDVLRRFDLYDDVFEMGLGAYLDPATNAKMARKVVQARAILRFWIEEEVHHGLVEPFDGTRYTAQASVASNLIFAAARDERALEAFMFRPQVRKVLDRAGIMPDLLDMGTRIAATLTELIDAADGDTALLRGTPLVDSDELGALARRNTPFSRDNVRDRSQLLRFALRYVEPRDRLGLLDEARQSRMVGCRLPLHEAVATEIDAHFSPYEIDEYTPDASILENMLFGKVRIEAVDGRTRMHDVIMEVVAGLDLRDRVVQAGLSSEIGQGGQETTPVQRQKIALARAVLKRSDILVLNRALEPLGVRGERVMLEALKDEPGGLIAILAYPENASLFDRVLMVSGGTIIEEGQGVLLEKTG